MNLSKFIIGNTFYNYYNSSFAKELNYFYPYLGKTDDGYTQGFRIVIDDNSHLVFGCSYKNTIFVRRGLFWHEAIKAKKEFTDITGFRVIR